ncbi:hypothetical protein G7K_5366-t1 [Saitoella complicata NRRL Y-17804]|uniref:Uncharacterized protein n=1 Tax=Saitoella complicata (strain BCRC 22490 / CBS 7301 / JCM 7358 / NBRC 10748 / NRRL Y-17804) TaxID=698492 RepID=A0A0E9NPA4_SAICN|nr:hypothetical protein G7K_5366-t1 [Saitoella complicata NRRL Y-17804]
MLGKRESDVFSLPSTQQHSKQQYNMADQGLQEVDEGMIQSNWEEVVDNFDNMDLKSELLRGIYAYGTFSYRSEGFA